MKYILTTLVMMCFCMSMSAQTPSMDGQFQSSSVSATSLTVIPKIKLSSSGTGFDDNVFVFTVSNTSKITSVTSSSMGGSWTGYSLSVSYNNGTGVCSLTVTAPGSMINIPTTFTDLCTVVFANSGTSSDNTDLTWNTNSLQSGVTAGTFTNVTNQALPVSLVYFKVNKSENKNVLSWKTAGEHNSDYFLLEKSFDGKVFDLIAKIESSNSVGTSDYSFSDVEQNFCYYRLKQFDVNGTESNLGTICGMNKNSIPDLRIFPNPTSGTLSLVNMSIGTTLKIFDVSGREVYRLNTSQSNTTSIDLSYLIPGTYFLSVLSNDQSTVRVFRKIE